MSKDFFPPRPEARPTIYAYEDTNPQYANLLKVGYTTVDVQSRVAQQYPILKPGKPPYRIVLEESAMRNDGTVFTDRDVHRMLRINGVKNPDGEWFRCKVAQVKAAIIAVRMGQLNEENRSLDFTMRPEQKGATGPSRHTSSGMPRCDLGRLLPPINWRKGWGGAKCWSLHSNRLCKAPGKRT